jgi:peptide chain release factor 1
VLLTGAAPSEVELVDADLKEDFYRASGPGGQHRNVTDTAVRLTHAPTGLVVVAERSRSRAHNREAARQELTRRLVARAASGHEAYERDRRRDQVAGAGRPSKGWTWNAQRGVVTDHTTGASYPMAHAERGKF